MTQSIIGFFLLFSLLSVHKIKSQDINFVEITDQFDLPDGIKIFKGTRENPALELFYTAIDLQDENITIKAFKFDEVDNVRELTKKAGAYLGINGGFFSGSTAFSSVVHSGKVDAINVRALNRNGKTYPVIRGFFGLTTDEIPSVDWVYHFNFDTSGMRKFNVPMPYVFNDPQPLSVPQETNGTPYSKLMAGIGGGPVLVKNSISMVTYNEEIMWGSGVGLANSDPRSAVGYTAEGKVIFLVTDGRQSQSAGLSLAAMADVMIELGCIAALNLDGGGSSQMAVPGAFVNKPSELRKMPTVLVVTHPDSLGQPEQIINGFIEDTDSPRSTIVGSWNASANSGFYGESNSLITTPGTGEKFVNYEPEIISEALYEVFAWWVASSNRVRDAPYIIKHVGGTDTVRMNQSTNGSAWQLLGRYFLDDATTVTITDQATQGDFVVADAIRFTDLKIDVPVDKLSAQNDTIVILAGETMRINVLQNDDDFDLSDTKITIVSNPSKGKAILNADNTVSYTADASSSGSDEIIYRFCVGDLDSRCDEAVVKIEITGLTLPLGFSEGHERKTFTFYPSPAKDFLMIEHNKTSPFTLRIMTLSGEIIEKSDYAHPASIIKLSVSDLPAGLYLLGLFADGNHEFKKVFIN